MQSTTPTPPPRNRRAGRITALPPEQPLFVPQTPDAPQQTAAPAVPPQAAPVIQQQPYAPQQTYAAPPRPQAAAPRPAAPQPYAGGYEPQQPYVQTPPVRPAPAARSYQPPAQPVPRRTTPVTQTREAPAGARPRAYGQPVPAHRDDPETRRAAAQERRRKDVPAKEPAEQPEKRSSVPSFMWTLLSLMLIGVLALTAVCALKMAGIRTTMRARETAEQKAWDNLLYKHHLTQQADGSFRIPYQDLIERYAAQYNLEPAFVAAIILNESSFRPDAVSGVNARGLMQMLSGTAGDVARALGEPFNFDNLFDPQTSIRYGCWYLNMLAERYAGDPVLVCAAYHAGFGAVDNWLLNPAYSADGATIPIALIPFDDTRPYVQRVTTAYGVYAQMLYPQDADAP